MHVRITGDTTAESGVGEIIGAISGPTRRHFEPKDYGSGLLGLVVVLMCQPAHLDLRRRVRFSQKEKKLYMDIMLNHQEMVSATPHARLKTIADLIQDEIPHTLSKYKIQEFDQQRFVDDISSWMKATAEQPPERDK